jgi:hypothetical protein
MDITLAIKNFPAQQSIFASPARHKIAVKGRRFGLTKGAANDYMVCAFNKTFKRGLWVDTVNSNIDRYVERFFLPHLHKIPQDLWHWRKQEKILEMFGTYIDFRSADRPENIEGFGYDKYFINEAGIVLKDEYLWNNAIKPMLWDYEATGVVGGTPKGKGEFFRLAERGKDPAQTGYEFFHFTSFDNPYLNHTLLKEDMASMPDRVIKQEIYAEFLDDSGVVFREVMRCATAEPQSPKNDHMYVMGVDLAKVQDFTVLTVYDRTNNHQVYQKRMNQLDWNLQKKYIYETCKHYNNALVMLDATGLGDPIADDLSRMGVPVEPFKLTNESKKQIIEKLVIWIEQGKMRFINLPETITELTNFTYDISSSGRIMYEAPAGFHDDIVIAHALAVWSLQPVIVPIKPKETSILHQEYLRQLGGHNEQSVQDWDEWESA